MDNYFEVTTWFLDLSTYHIDFLMLLFTVTSFLSIKTPLPLNIGLETILCGGLVINDALNIPLYMLLISELLMSKHLAQSRFKTSIRQ